MTRDAEETRRRIVEATGRILERDGFQALGVNAVASEAGVGKPLIYRYFGGLGPLVENFGREADVWLSANDVLAGSADGRPVRTYADAIEHIVTGHLRALRERPLSQEVMLWELTGKREVVAPLEARREETEQVLMERLFEGLEPPPGVDAAALNAVLLAAVHYLVLRARTIDRFAGLDLKDPEHMARIDRALQAIVAAIYEPGGGGTGGGDPGGGGSDDAPDAPDAPEAPETPDSPES